MITIVEVFAPGEPSDTTGRHATHEMAPDNLQ
jgi:hypothetical protein